ncbi:MAG: 23S rRNA (pseudouridine(1915)-N(3))-methyltransferase RlmH [Fretibacterium sp.]|nr:23S rRNA (pseudouridine(1915)-N(3))-methyltransferase RlmH [Fretibacterium sp.]
MKLLVLKVGRTKDRRVSALAENYLRRIRPPGMTAVESVPDIAAASSSGSLEREGQELLRRVRPRDRVILLREDGEEFDSLAFASFIAEELEGVAGRLLLVIGGPWGVSDALKQRANRGLSLSRMTLPHDLCFLFLAEQLYRAFSILQGTGYHH